VVEAVDVDVEVGGVVGVVAQLRGGYWAMGGC
jgi:hypothetical protein